MWNHVSRDIKNSYPPKGSIFNHVLAYALASQTKSDGWVHGWIDVHVSSFTLKRLLGVLLNSIFLRFCKFLLPCHKYCTLHISFSNDFPFQIFDALLIL